MAPIEKLIDTCIRLSETIAQLVGRDGNAKYAELSDTIEQFKDRVGNSYSELSDIVAPFKDRVGKTTHNELSNTVVQLKSRINTMRYPKHLETIVLLINRLGNTVIYLLLGGALGALVLPAALFVMSFMLGFLSGGIQVATIAATLMSRHGGFTPRGSFVSFMQSIGARGLRGAFSYKTVVCGAVIGTIAGGYCAFHYYDVNAYKALYHHGSNILAKVNGM
ncbi:hypothetical protein FBU30_007263 [Linnemannia zychae]|nr:hypothetical protein FBU30_007263 [Linnemannia zychae]